MVPFARLSSPKSAVSWLLLAVLAAWLLVNLVESPSIFIDVLLIGITTGCVYALIALGYTLVYGILELINFAHGDVFMCGGMITATVAARLGVIDSTHGARLLIGAVLAFAAAVIGCGLLNALIELVAYRPLRGRPRLTPLITAIGVSFILQDVALALKGPNYVNAPDVLPHTPVLSVDGVAVTLNKVIVMAITLPALAILVFLVQRTRQGKAMRAIAQDIDAAAMLGVNINRTISFTYLLAGALAGVAGTIYAFYVTSVRFDEGFQLGLIAFTAAVLGGIGNLPGAVVGAALIGLIQACNEGLPWHAPGSDWTEAVVFALLILILIFRPEGLLGEQAGESL